MIVAFLSEVDVACCCISIFVGDGMSTVVVLFVVVLLWIGDILCGELLLCVRILGFEMSLWYWVCPCVYLLLSCLLLHSICD